MYAHIHTSHILYLNTSKHEKGTNQQLLALKEVYTFLLHKIKIPSMEQFFVKESL